MNQPQWKNYALVFSEETRIEVVRLYREEELTMREVAERLNASEELPATMTTQNVDRILEMAHVPPRPNRPPPKPTQPKRRWPNIPGIDKEYMDDRKSIAQLARQYQLNKRRIREMLIDMGVTIRPPGNPSGKSNKS